MSDLYAVAGAKFYIGDAMEASTSDLTDGDFSGISWTEVDGWETMGEIGDEAEIITTNLINRGRVNKQKGTRDAGDMENTFADLPSDTGQIAMKDAFATTQQNYAFRIVFDDAATVGGTGSEAKFVGIVSSQRQQGGSANTTRMRAFTVAINSNIVIVEAT